MRTANSAMSHVIKPRIASLKPDMYKSRVYLYQVLCSHVYLEMYAYAWTYTLPCLTSMSSQLALDGIGLLSI